ncbi:MAG TPA: FtsX-like permease family protein, partial [Usitatibacter sp.]|nr:FtsX-like permease family protein [Usitatibacter sp.]
VDGLYIQGQGFNSTPVHLLDDPRDYLARFHHEEALAAGGRFSDAIARLSAGEVLPSAALAAYLRPSSARMPVGREDGGGMATAPVAGVLRLLPGSPEAAVAARDSFSTARVDYLNFLFDQRASLTAAASSPHLARVDMLIPRVAITLRPRPGVPAEVLRAAVLAALPARPLDTRDVRGEVERLGSDMYVFLARENVRISLAAGLLMALLGMAAVALANFADDRRTLALLRVRGARRRDVLAFLAAGLTAPAVAGIALGVPIAFVVGYGITQVLWRLRDLRTILVYLPAHPAAGPATAAVAAVLCAGVLLMVAALGRWVFRRTAQGGLMEH